MALRQFKLIRSSPGSAPSAAFDSNVLSGSLIVVLVSYYSSGLNGAITVSDNNGNSYTHTVNNSGGSGATRGCLAWAPNVNAGATTVTVSSNGTGDQYISAVACEFDDIVTASPLDQSASSGGTSTTATTGTTGTTTQNEELVIGFHGVTAVTSMSTPSGYTNIALLTDNSTYQPHSFFYRYVTTTGTQVATSALGVNEEYVGGIATFFQAAGGSPTLTQAAFRFVNDDGSESGSTFAAAQNTDVSVAAGSDIRIRVGIQAVNDPDASQFRLEYRRIGDSNWQVVT